MMNLIFYLILPFLTSLQGFGFDGIESSYNDHCMKMRSHITMLDDPPIEEKWIEQPLDHFDSNEKRTWKMRYWQNLQFSKQDGPIYVFAGDQSIDSGPWVLGSGLTYDLAKETNGSIFLTEQRYYGASIPLPRNITENLKYLTSSQILADYSHLLEFIKSSSNYTKSNVAVIGGGYGGNLAAWMRLLYPNLVQGAIASSAPLLAKKDFYEYFEVVSDDYKYLSIEGCLKAIVEIFERFDHLFKSAEGIKQLMAEKNICKYNDMTKRENRYNFFYEQTARFRIMAEAATPLDLTRICHDIMNDTDIEFLKKSHESESTAWRTESKCHDYDINHMVKTADLNHIMMNYQRCTEFGHLITTTSDRQPFTSNIPGEYFYRLCAAYFGPEFDEQRVDEGVKLTNRLYGGQTPNVTRVIFSNGAMDPFYRLGVVRNISDDAPAILIPTYSRAKDISQPAYMIFDTPEMVAAKNQEKYLIKKWLDLL